MFKNFCKEEQGSVVIVFALILLPLLAVLALSVDYGRAYNRKQIISRSLDAAALAVTRLSPGKTDEEIRQVALNVFRSNIPETVAPTNNVNLINNATQTLPEGSIGLLLSQNADRTSFTLQAMTNISTMFGHIGTVSPGGGGRMMGIGARSSASRQIVNLELVVAVDLSGSMNQDAEGNSNVAEADRRITGARDAIREMRDVLIAPQSVGASGADARLGIVPWSTNVRLPQANLQVTANDQNFMPALLDNPFNIKPFACSQTSPFTTPQYKMAWDRAKEDGGSISVGASWLPNEAEPAIVQEQGLVVKDIFLNWDNPHDVKGMRSNGFVRNYYNKDSGSFCPRTAPLDLTSNTSDIEQQIVALDPNGSTDASSGIYWAWRMLSQADNVFAAQNAPDFDEDTNKVLVLISDGSNNTDVHQGSFPYSYSDTDYKNWTDRTSANHAAYGDLDLGLDNYLTITQDEFLNNTNYQNSVNGRMLSICQAVKASGITIYTIGYGLNETSVKNRHAITALRLCATQPPAGTQQKFFYDVSNNQQLKNAFIEISAGVQRLQLTE